MSNANPPREVSTFLRRDVAKWACLFSHFFFWMSLVQKHRLAKHKVSKLARFWTVMNGKHFSIASCNLLRLFPQKSLPFTSQGRITHLAVSTTYTRIYPGMVGWGAVHCKWLLQRRFRALRLANHLQPLQVSNGWSVALKGWHAVLQQLVSFECRVNDTSHRRNFYTHEAHHIMCFTFLFLFWAKYCI